MNEPTFAVWTCDAETGCIELLKGDIEGREAARRRYEFEKAEAPTPAYSPEVGGFVGRFVRWGTVATYKLAYASQPA
jgi:hypothetical protein